MNEEERIEELVEILNNASKAYYNGQDEVMSNYEWDAMFDELTMLEKSTGFILPNSPTQNAGYEEKNGEKELHEYPALSLAKTKSIAELQKWAENRAIWLSWKLDGLTLVVTYDHGSISKILTRGNGTTGSNITYMKDAIIGIPSKISYEGHMVVRGEATISYSDFEIINALLSDDDEKYANPRNLASGTFSLDVTNLEIVKERRIHFNAFTLVHIDDDIKSWGSRMDFLDKLGFITVEREKTNTKNLPEVVEKWTEKVETGKMDIPVDGLVICYDDNDYAQTGSVTGHHATRAGFAFKWQDVSVETKLKYIEWSCAASTISPVAVFEPVQLEGTTVTRASLCNISEMERLGIGEDGKTTIEVIKANKIIPKCISVKKKIGEFIIPEKCPVCHHMTEIKISASSGTKTLHCTNPNCIAKHIKKFTRFVSETGMNIDGLSMQTIIKFMNLGYLTKFSDFYNLDSFIDQIKELDGFGEKSCDNLMRAIEKSRNVNPVHFIYALCIPLIGIDAGKKIIKAIGYHEFLNRLEKRIDFMDIEGIGPEKSNSIMEWYDQKENQMVFNELLSELNIENVEPDTTSGGRCEGLTFVITGDVHYFKNRTEFKAYVESQNGVVTGSVSKKTNYLVNNDLESNSSKNQKAKSLGIPILSENQFVDIFVK